jgi:hypothetical protein
MTFNRWKLGLVLILLSQLKVNAFMIYSEMIERPSQFNDLNSYFNQNTSQTLQSYKNYLDQVVAQNMKRFLQLENAKKPGECTTNTQATFYNGSSASQELLIGAAAFENDIVIGSGSTCLKAPSAKNILDVLFSENFLLATIKGVSTVQIYNDKNVICQQNSVFPFGKANFCFSFTAAGDQNHLVVRISHLENNPGASYSVYFQEGLILIKKIKENTFRVSTYNIGRGPNIPFHGLALKVIQTEQTKYFDQLNAYFGTPYYEVKGVL